MVNSRRLKKLGRWIKSTNYHSQYISPFPIMADSILAVCNISVRPVQSITSTNSAINCFSLELSAVFAWITHQMVTLINWLAVQCISVNHVTLHWLTANRFRHLSLIWAMSILFARFRLLVDLHIDWLNVTLLKVVLCWLAFRGVFVLIE
jgi:hypothetical protein